MPPAGKRRASKRRGRKRNSAVESLVAYLANRELEFEYASRQDAAGGEQRIDEHYEHRRRLKAWLVENDAAIRAAVDPLINAGAKPVGSIDLFPDVPFLYRHCYLPKSLVPDTLVPGMVADGVLVFLCKTFAAEMAANGFTFTVMACGGAADAALEATIQICLICYD